MLRLLALIITIPLSLFVLLFAVSNTQTVPVHLNFFDMTRELPQYVVSLGLMAFGFLAGCLLVWLNLYKYRIKFWRAERKLAKYEEEIAKREERERAIENMPPLEEHTALESPQRTAFYDE